jgi:ATP-dependent Lon protease
MSSPKSKPDRSKSETSKSETSKSETSKSESGAEDLAPALAELPLFPLHDAVLFPGMLMPLHVFEPRYRALVRDVLASHRTFAVAHVVDPDADMLASGEGNCPTLSPIAGLGTILEHWELPGGRFNLMLIGRGRVQLQELDFVPPYRRARATVLDSEHRAVPAVELAAFHAAASAFAALMHARDDSFRLRLPKDAGPGMLADACAHQLIISGRERQRVLELCDVRERVRFVTETLTIQRATLAPVNSPTN